MCWLLSLRRQRRTDAPGWRQAHAAGLHFLNLQLSAGRRVAHAGDRPDGHARLFEGAGMEFQPGEGADRAESAIHRRGVAGAKTIESIIAHSSAMWYNPIKYNRTLRGVKHLKDQYVGDVGDYGKYGLLRYLSQKGIKIGVNWYLTRNDDIVVNGNIRGYLDNEDESKYDRDVFFLLKYLPERSIGQIESSNIIPNALFYSELLTIDDLPKAKRWGMRKAWHNQAMRVLADAELIFADPDVGSTDDETALEKGGEKYVALGELQQYYESGKDVVYYCQRARRTPEQWREKMLELTTMCPNIRIIALTYRRGTQRSYIFGIHPERFSFYDTLLDDFLKTSWGTYAVKNKNIPFFMEEVPEVFCG